MENKIKVAIIGLDTSHAVEFPKLMQDPAVPEQNQVHDLVATRCLRFETPFQNKEGLDKRQAYLESIGVMVTEDFDTAVADCDAIMIEINDPAKHLEYFEKCAGLGKADLSRQTLCGYARQRGQIMQIGERKQRAFLHLFLAPV